MDVEYFKGPKGIQKIFTLALQNNEKVLRTVLTDKPLVYLVGDDFSEMYMSERSKNQIFLKSLRLSSIDVDLPKHKDYAKHNKEVKVAPKDVTFNDSLVIWDDFVAIVDVNTLSCVLIKNAKNATVMKKWFDYVWDHFE